VDAEESAQSSEPAGEGGQPGEAASRRLSGTAFVLLVLAGVAGCLLIVFLPGLGRGTRIAASFIFVPVVVTPVIGTWSKFPPETLLVGSVLGGEFAAALYATGQGPRFGRWLIFIELAALILAPRTLHMLRVARVPGVPRDPAQPPSLAGAALIVLLTPLALAAAVLDAMARLPAGAAVGALVPGVITAVRGDTRDAVITMIAAPLLALIPAVIRWALLRGRPPRN
jgi:hypothetical protein